MTDSPHPDESEFHDVLKGLTRGDFSRLEPHFIAHPDIEGSRPQILVWHENGRFAQETKAEAEALTCACFLGRVDVAEYLLGKDLNPNAGIGTGMNAFHWAVDRGQLEVVRLLIRHKTPLETLNMYGGTMLGTAVWSAIKEPRPDHPLIIEELLAAGARFEAAGYPTGHESIDLVLKPHNR